MKKIKFIENQIVEYEIRKLVDLHNPILRTPTEWVDFEKLGYGEVAYMGFSLMETLNELSGLGLSANQIGYSYRMFALNVGDKIWCLINPRVTYTSPNLSKYKEGCLSYPGLYLDIGRPETVKVQFQALGGQTIEQEFNGLTATCVMHELDHLDGIMYTDKVPRVKLMRAKEKVKSNLKKMKKLAVAS
jgi:peptide deformylase